MSAQPNLKYIDVDYNLMLSDPTPQVEKINQFLGGGLDGTAMLGVIDPLLYRQRN
jgi:hypothetical protein